MFINEYISCKNVKLKKEGYKNNTHGVVTFVGESLNREEDTGWIEWYCKILLLTLDSGFTDINFMILL